GENGQVIFRTEAYPKAKIGAAWAFSGGKWQWSSTGTPGAVNSISAVAEKTSKVTQNSGSNQLGNPNSTPATVPPNTTSNALAIGSGVAAIGYGLYEFRFDMRNRWRLIKKSHFLKKFKQ
ncbi:MAG: hypothetical protein WDZ81_00745, partial [Candidatus Saccharimonadales bacterium]